MGTELENIIFNPIVGKIATVIVGLIIIWFIVRLIQRRLISRISDNNNSYKAKKLSSFVGFLITVLLISIVFSDQLGGLTVAFGVAGAGIAFALQEVIVSFAGWIAIIFGKYFHSGDRIQLGGITGDVIDISILRTTIMETGQWVNGDLYNGRIVYVSNSNVFKEPVFNYSGNFPFLWDEIKIPIQYGSNYDKAKEILQVIGNEVVDTLTKETKMQWQVLQRSYRLENARIEPMVSLIANDNWVEFTLRYVVDFKKRRVTKTDLFTKILKEVEKTNGEIKFASATFQLVEPPDFNVNVSDKK